ncbi:NifB/NifX family molybdenum-iron cluster-binding protein [archaeon]|nr:NifB/NifX family molybdenum-iron cluster-binding protein [archaeon]MBT3450807.1 NifB/NifX family molybdenum-iron cluster-binding protein [archaeon]MBT6868484.1 NifB/NifX family molybdenum-iron cluster-binding protein [archaeon]MBT7193583.1 NifB/NifX family molybdenum-iron cluster-binding protein [archaeon]MBT7380284.1 NifB/NifX family molybdenum-iron cluster-binding protein [archaeon]
MEIAISTNGNSLDSLVDQRFGRCNYFLVIELLNQEIINFKAVENEGAKQGHGAGIKAAQQINKLNVNFLITGNLGPNAANVLNQSEIKVYQGTGNIREVIEKFNNNELKEISQTVEGHSNTETIKEKSDERIFFPLINDKGIDSDISTHFGHAPYFGVYDKVKNELKIIEMKLDHTNSTKSPVDQIIETVNPTTIFALGIGARAIQLFNEKGISIKTGNFKIVKEVIENWDKLDSQIKSCAYGHN